jgi:thiosulfate/3-mercaptopyruvate sulfurtransferase
MLKTLFRAATALLAVQLTASVVLAQPGRAPMLVTTSWLSDHLSDPRLVVLHVASLRRDYDQGHVPGARYLWVGALAQSTPEMSFEAVPVPQIRKALEALGVSNRSRIVLCGVGGNVSPTARMFLTLEYVGLGDSTSILDGQFDAWKSEGRTVSKEAPRISRGSFKPRVHDDVFVSADWVKDHVNAAGVAIVDARAPQFYAGASAGQPRSGHIPSARNVYFATLVDSTNRFLPDAKLQELFDKAGVGPGDEIAAYCHVGQTASLVYVAAERLGHRVHLYDGSFDEWSGRMDLPVELPAKPDSTARPPGH